MLIYLSSFSAPASKIYLKNTHLQLMRKMIPVRESIWNVYPIKNWKNIQCFFRKNGTLKKHLFHHINKDYWIYLLIHFIFRLYWIRYWYIYAKLLDGIIFMNIIVTNHYYLIGHYTTTGTLYKMYAVK